MKKETSKLTTPTGYSSFKGSSLYTQRGFIDSGNALFNWSMSGHASGGYPKGKVIELFGEESTGKSLLATIAMANLQKEGGVAVLDDVEFALTPEFSRSLGLSLGDNFIVGNPTTIERWEKAAEGLIEKLVTDGVKDALFVLDSIAQLSTDHEEESPVETRDMTKAYMARKVLRMLMPKFASSNYTLIALNHIVANIGNMFTPKTATGGSGLKFGSTVRVELTYAGRFPQEKSAVTEGVFTRFYIKKNRVAPPFRGGTMYIDFAKGIARYSGVLDKLLDYGIATAPKGSRKITLMGKEFSKRDFEENFGTDVAKELGAPDGDTLLDKLLASVVGKMTPTVETTSDEEDE